MNATDNISSKVRILLSIFFISVSLFVYQVVLTRLYSAVFLYHFVFLITSFAIFGSGIGSIIAYKTRRRQRKRNETDITLVQPVEDENIKKKINKVSLVLALSYIMVFTFSYLFPVLNNLFVYTILGTFPFIIGGYLFSEIFTEFTGMSGKLYFADLVGSGAGSLAVIYLLNNVGMFRSVIALCIIVIVPVFILPSGNRQIRIARYLFSIILIATLLLPGQYVNTIEKNYKGILNNSQKTFGNIKKAGLSPEIVFSEWNAFSRTDVIKVSEEADEMILTIDGAANAPMYKFDGDIKSLEVFKQETGFLPFTIGKSDKTLLIGPGGGRDVLYALAGESKEIIAVEINTSSIDAVRAFGDYNGNIYQRPELKVYGEDGRSFVRRSSDKYDLIFLSLVMTNTSQGTGYALSENYIYTVEAMTDYLDHLNDNGKIAFLVHDEKDLSKIVATVIQALSDKGIPIKDTPKYISVFTKYMPMEHGGVHLSNPVIIIKNIPFSENESLALVEAAERNGIMPIYAPLIYEQSVLHHIEQAHISMTDYLNGFEFNAAPATDDSPYFYNFKRGVSSTLWVILFVMIIGSTILFLPFAIKHGKMKPVTYFSLLGIGFMMIEIPLIQKFILYLGHPTLAFTYVLAALLVGAGLGGYLSSNKFFDKIIKSFYLPPIAVAVINIVLLISLSFIFKSTSNLDIRVRVIIASIIVMVQGFFMGMPFPRGLKLVSEGGRSDIVPVMWGVNGMMSVIGSVLATIISMLVGFTGAMIVGGLIYLGVSFYIKL